MYIKYYDNRFGDLYEVYFSDDGEFESAVRSVGEVGREAIYYDSLTDIPPYHRNQIENLIWHKLNDNERVPDNHNHKKDGAE